MCNRLNDIPSITEELTLSEWFGSNCWAWGFARWWSRPGVCQACHRTGEISTLYCYCVTTYKTQAARRQ